MSLAKVSKLNNTIFIASSGNLAKISVLGPGGLRVNYLFKPTEKDMKEASDYITSTIGATDFTSKLYINSKEANEKQEFEDYRKFLNEENET